MRIPNNWYVFAVSVLPGSLGLASYVDLRISERSIGGSSGIYSDKIVVDVQGINTLTRQVTGVGVAMSNVADPTGWDYQPVPNNTPAGYFPKSATYSAEVSSANSLLGLTIQPNWRIRLDFSDGSASVYGFTVNTANVTAGQFTGLPRITSPLNGAIGVSADATITWESPSNVGGTTEAWAAHQPLASIFETGTSLSTDDTSWTPGDIAANGDRISIQYTNPDADGTLSSLSLVSGQPVTWAIPGQIDFGDWPTLKYISSDEVTVNVVPEPGSLAMIALLGLAGRRRRATHLPARR